MDVELGYVLGRRPHERAFVNALDEELVWLRAFLGLTETAGDGR